MFPLPPLPVVGAVPFPVNMTEAAGVDCPLIVILTLPVEATAVVGAKVTEAVAVPPFAAIVRLAGDTANGAEVLRFTVTDEAPELVTVNVLAALVCPVVTAPK